MPRSRARQWADLLASTPVQLDNNNRLTVGDAATASATLDVATTSGNASVEIQAPSDSHSILKFGDTADNDVGHITYDHTADYMSFTSNASEAMRVNSDGELNIGTTSGGAKLRISKGSSTSAMIVGGSGYQTIFGYSTNSDNYISSGTSGHPAIFRVGSTEVARINNSGKLGIGTTSPSTPLEINTANTLGSTFTGTTAGEGIEVSQTSYTANDYVSLIEGKYLSSQTAPHVRIGAQYTGSGSKLVFGTSNSYASGITNTAMVIDQSGDITVSGSITPGSYRPGEIIETIACMCDGSTVSVLSGDYTITNVSAAESATTSYAVMGGSSISYTPPAGTKRVLYRYNFKWDCTGYSGISHFKFQIDGTDVVPASRQYSSNYASTNWHHANLELGIEWVIDCDAASDDAANGKFTSWTSAKTLRGLHRAYGGGYAHRLHGNVWWDGTGASGGYNNPIKPFLYIQAIG